MNTEKKTFICRVHSISTETTPSQVDTEIIISHVEQKNKEAQKTEAMSNMEFSICEGLVSVLSECFLHVSILFLCLVNVFCM
jgi:hypothetical protein